MIYITGNLFREATKGKKYIQPENVMVANDLAVIHRIISKARLKVFACIKEYRPKEIIRMFGGIVKY